MYPMGVVMSKPCLTLVLLALCGFAFPALASSQEQPPLVSAVESKDARTGLPAEADAPSTRKPTRYLLVGDSMAWAIGIELDPLIEARGDKFTFKSKISASIRGWRSGKHIKKTIQRYKPDAVIIVLGTNESQIPYPQHLEDPIKKIVAAVGDRACYWIGPPTWRKGKSDTGVVALLESSAGPCRFFDSIPLELPRRPDGVHPDREGSRLWAKAIFDWIEAHPPGSSSVSVAP